MRVLIAHNRYQSTNPSGENTLVDAEIGLLRSAGVEIIPLIENSDRLLGGSPQVRASAALGPIYSPTGVRRFQDLLKTYRPDVVHLHNPFPFISPFVVRVAVRHNVPVVQTVHNYRHSCVNGLHFRAGAACMDCYGHTIPTPAIEHGCYRGSRLQTLPMALGQITHRKTWRLVSRFLTLTPFMADHLIRQGIDPSRVVVRPTWVPDNGGTTELGHNVLFVGRLEKAKGVELLLRAWSQIDGRESRTLHIVGSGPLARTVRAAADSDHSIRFSGALDSAGVIEAMAQASVVVLPSLSYEGYPLVMAEAFANSRPVLTLTGGSPASVVGNNLGWVCAPRAEDLAHCIRNLSRQEARAKGRAARQFYEANNSPKAALESLTATYAELIGGSA